MRPSVTQHMCIDRYRPSVDRRWYGTLLGREGNGGRCGAVTEMSGVSSAASPSVLRFDRATESIPQRLADVAEMVPDHAALSDGAIPFYTFGQLTDATRAASAWLRAEHPDGIAPVALLMEHLPLTLAMELAVIGAGRPVVLLDTTQPPELLKAVVEDALPVATFCSPDALPLAAELGSTGAIHPIDRLPEGPSGSAVPGVKGRDPAFLMFTSGSTGQPKGVLSNHRALLSGARALGRERIMQPGDRMALITPLGLAGAVCQFTGALLNGAETCMFPLQLRGVQEFVSWMRTARISVFPTVPTLARAAAGALGGDRLPDLARFWIGGEALQLEDVEQLRSMASGPVRIAHAYVSTETMLMALSVIEPGDDPLELFPLSIGRPIDGVGLDLDRVQEGDQEVGEIIVTTTVVTEGYWCRPELTRRKFDIDTDNDVLRFRTGDLGRHTSSGINIVGRVDSMVKIRGQRVELGAVETAIRAVPGVDHVAVSVTDDLGAEALVAHVAGSASDPPVPSRVKGELRRHVPAVMVPRFVVVHDELPRLPNGKVDRLALTEFPVSSDRVLAARAPQTERERRIAKLMAEVLGRPELAANADFFESGGDSLQATELLVRIADEFGVTLPMSSWIDYTTAAGLAEALERELGGRATLVRIQGGEPDQPPLVVASDLHGSAFRFKALAAAAGADQPMWGLDNPLLAGTANMPSTLEDLAALHAADLVKVDPVGPYHLLGYSFGAVVAVEMARQLLAAGRSVGFLGLVDYGPVHLRHAPRGRDVPRPPGGWTERAPSDQSLVRRTRHHITHLRTTPPGQRTRYLSRVFGAARPHDLFQARSDLRRTGQIRPELRGAVAWYRSMDLALAYSFPRLDHDAVLFVCDQTMKGRMNVGRRLDYASATQPLLGWDGVVTGDITVVPLVGHHNDLVEEPYVAAVGTAVRTAFDKWLASH